MIAIDDLCDAGGTYLSLANAIPKHVKADLFIYHGVFTNCAPIRLFKHYENIFVSNSLPHVDEMANIFKQWKKQNINYKQACEQLNVTDFIQYKDFTPGNLIVFDVWNNAMN